MAASSSYLRLDGGVLTGPVTFTTLNGSSVTTTNLFATSTTLVNATSTNLFTTNLSSTNATSTNIFVSANYTQSVRPDSKIIGSVSSSTIFSGPRSVVVSGKYAYVVNTFAHSLSIIDISNPALPSVVSTLVSSTILEGASGVQVAGNYAYVVSTDADSLAIVDVSNPSNPAIVGSVASSTVLNGARSIFVSGKHAYIASYVSGNLQVVDVSNPSNPVILGGVSGLGGFGVTVSGKYAYVAGSAGNKMSVVDVSNPSAPSLVGGCGGDCSLLSFTDIKVSGKYAYAIGDARLSIFDISNPTSFSIPVVGSTYQPLVFDGVHSLFVAGKYAYMANFDRDSVAIFDISSSTNPSFVSEVSNGTDLNQAAGIYVAGKYAYATAAGKFHVIDIGGIDTPSANIAALQVSNLNLTENLTVANDAYITNGLVVGAGGILANGSVSVVGGLSASTITSTYFFATTTNFVNFSSTNATTTNFVFTNAQGTSITSTNVAFTYLNGTNATTTNLAVTGLLSLPTNSITDTMVVDGLTISGGTINNTPIGASTPSTGIFTNATSTNFFATGLSFTNAVGTSITSTNAMLTSLSFGTANGTSITSTNGFFTTLATTDFTSTNVVASNITSTNINTTGLTFTSANGANLTMTSVTTTNLALQGFSNGSILFVTSSGRVTQDNANLYWDDVNNRLGIGLSNPSRSLQVNGEVNALTSAVRGTSVGFSGLDSANNAAFPRAFFYGYSGSAISNFGLYAASGNATGTTQTASFVGISTNADPKQASSIQALNYIDTTKYVIYTTQAENAQRAVPIYIGHFSQPDITIATTGRVGFGNVTAPSARLSLAADTTATGGLAFGTDTNLYRSAADTLRTDDSFIVGSALTFGTASGTSITSTNAFFATLNATSLTSTNVIATNATTTNLAVTGLLSLPTNSITDTMVVDGLTISGGTINNTPIGASTPSTGIFTNATSTNLFATGLSFTNATGTGALTVATTTVTGGFFQTGLSTCNADTQALAYNATTGKFECGDDDIGGGGLTINTNQIAFGAADGSVTTTASFTFSTSTNTLSVTNIHATSITTTNFVATGLTTLASTTLSGLVTINGTASNPALMVNSSGNAQVLVNTISDSGNTSLVFGTGGNSFALMSVGSSGSALAGANSINFYTEAPSPYVFWNNDTERMRLDENGRLGIGTSTPETMLHVAGGVKVEGAFSQTPLVSPQIIGTSTLPGTGDSVFVAGKYAYVVGGTNPTFRILDISIPTTPSVIGTSSLFSGAGKSVFVAGKYAYVGANTTGFQIFDVSNPVAPTMVGTTTLLSAGNSTYVSGKYAYVVGGTFHILDVSNPSAPLVVSTSTLPGTGNSIYVFGKYAYVVGSTSPEFRIFDVSNPVAPVMVGTSTLPGTGTGVYVAGRYAYVTGFTAPHFRVIDVSKPTAPVMVGTSTLPGTGNSVYVAGKYAYVAGGTSPQFQVLDISRANAPTIVGTSVLPGTGNSVYVAGKYAYVAGGTSPQFQVLDLGGIDASTAYIGALQMNTANISENAFIGNNAYVGNALNVGSGGVYTDGGIFQSGLGNCNATGDKLLYSSSTGKFSCDTDSGIDAVTVNTYTASTTWTKADYPGLSFVQVIVTAGGGGGGEGETDAAGDDAAGGGGGAGGTSISMISASSLGTTETVIVGVGGAGGSSGIGANNASNNGANGQPSAFGSHASSSPGFGGTGIFTTAAIIGRPGGSGGATTLAVGDIKLGGGGGGSGQATAVFSQGGSGGASYWGGGGAGGSMVSAVGADVGDHGVAYGSGGGGGVAVDINNVGPGGNGASGVVVVMNYTGSGGGDLAEWYDTVEGVEAGDVVALSVSTTQYNSRLGLQKISVLEKARAGSKVVGIVASAPFETMGADILSGSKRPRPIALAGRVPVKVSSENGPIVVGDQLTVSSQSGIAMRATKAGLTIGTALEDMVCAAEGDCTVLALVNTSYSTGKLIKEYMQNTGVEYDTISGELDYSKIILSQMIKEKKNFVATSTLSEILSDRIVAGLEIISPRVVTDELVVNTLASATTSTDISALLSLNGGFSFVGFGTTTRADGTFETSTVARIDARGNAFFAGMITADRISAREIIGFELPTSTPLDQLTYEDILMAFVSSSPAFGGMVSLGNVEILGGLSVSGTSTVTTLSAGLLIADEIRGRAFETFTTSFSDFVSSTSRALIDTASTTESIGLRLDMLESAMVSSTISSSSIAQVLENMFGSAISITQPVSLLAGLRVDTLSSVQDGGMLNLMSDVSFFGRPYFTSDTGGFARVKAGDREVSVTFEREYLETPVVQATISVDISSDTVVVTSTVDGVMVTSTLEEAIFVDDVRYVVTGVSPTGFTIRLNKPAPGDITFSWIALAVKNPKLFESVTPIVEIPEPQFEESVVIPNESSPEEVPLIDLAPSEMVSTTESSELFEHDDTTREGESIETIVSDSLEEVPVTSSTEEEVGTEG